MEDSRRPAEGDSQSETRVPSAEESPTVDYFPDTPGAMLRPGAFGRYVLVRRLGKGGFGEVWEAQDTTTSRRVALKILMNLRSARADIRQRFHREARVTGSLNHPHVVSVFGAEEVEGYPVISMEIAQGGTLQDRLNREGSLTVTAAVDAVLQIIEGLEAASAQGIIHRDIKPSNCFLDSGGAVKIGDFGLSRTSESDSILTESGVFMGTPAYASPEQVKGRAMDLRSDIYSLGATLYALLSGKPPFVADGPVEVLARILSEKPPPISQSRNPIPPGLARVLDLSLAKNPKDRFQTYSDLRSALIPYSSVGFVPAVPGRRLCSYLIDDLFFFSCVFFNQGFLSFVLVPWSYFLFFEWRWGTTPGKKAMGLRVVSPGDHRMSFLQALTRASSFVTMTRLPGWMLLPMSAGSMSVVASWLPLLIGAVSSFLPPVTMRKRNDYGCLHDLVSRTRVLAIRRQDGVEIQIPAWTPTPQAAGHTRFGVYEVRASVWSQGSEELLLGYDPVLSRNVWIYRHTGGTSRSVEALRFVRLQWLGGGEQEDGTWDVYECPPGTGLVDLLRHQGRLPWTFASRIVTELLGELELSQGESFFPTKLSLSHVWITTNGHVKLMQFPLHPQESSSCGMFSSESYLDFARQVLISALEGRVIEKTGCRWSRCPYLFLPVHGAWLAGSTASSRSPVSNRASSSCGS